MHADLKRFATKSSLFLIVLWVGAFCVAKEFDRYFRSGRTHKQFWMLSQRNGSFDYAILGSSRAFHNVDAGTLESRTGGKAINLAYDGHSLADVYLTFHLFLANQNRADHVLLQVDGWDLSYTQKFLAYLYFPYQADAEVAATLQDFETSQCRIMNIVFPLARYSRYNSFYAQTFLQQAKSNKSVYDSSAGSELLFDDGAFHSSQTVGREPEFRIDSRSKDYLDRIVALAESTRTQLTVFSAPIYNQDRHSNPSQGACHSFLSSYCQSHGINYVDCSDTEFDISEYRDFSHLNGHGALRFTAMLADSVCREEQNNKYRALR